MQAILIDIGIDLFTKGLVEQGTSGDKTKQAARAKVVSAYASATQQVLSGDAADAINTLTTEVEGDTAADPALHQAAANLIKLVGTQAGLANMVLGSTLLGSAAANAATAGLQEMVTVCAAYEAAAKT